MKGISVLIAIVIIIIFQIIIGNLDLAINGPSPI
jgi:hypothetical protein